MPAAPGPHQPPREPRALAARLERAPMLPAGAEERFAGYGVMGLPFASGHYLGLRRFPASSLGQPYTAVWWRDPAGRWVIFSDVSPGLSCARYFGRALARTQECEIDLAWSGPRSLRVTIPGALDWHVELGSSLASRGMTVLGGAAPQWCWRSPAVLHATALLAGPLLGVGTLRLQGRVPNGQWFQANPRVAWLVTASRATIDGQDAGPPGRLEHQPRLGDFWLPQRGVFFVGEAYFEPFDAARHTAAAARSAAAFPTPSERTVA